MRWVVRTEDVDARLMPASAPPYTPTALSTKGGLVRFVAAPGTKEIKAPAPASVGGAVRPEDRRGGGNSVLGWLPRMSIVFAANMQPPVRWASTNELPIPALTYVMVPQIASQAPTRLGGSNVIPAPRTFTRWASAVKSVASDG